MLFEGTAKYFWMLFLVWLLVYITKKVSLYFIFKKVRMNPSKAFIPVMYRVNLAREIGISPKAAYMSYIPFYGIKYRKEILDTLLKGFSLNTKDSIWYFIIPMYKYPELVFRNVNFVQNDYSLTEMFLESEKALSEVDPNPNDLNNVQNSNANFNDSIFSDNGVMQGTSTPINAYPPNMTPVTNQNVNLDTVFTNQNLEPDDRHERYVEAPKEEPKKEKPIITPLETGKNQVCPKCGATLTPNVTTCFMCGQRLV